MSDKEKAYEAFEKLLNNEIKKYQKRLDAKIIKNMNAVGDDGVTYTSEADIQDAYGYDLITDAERLRLLKALEYKENRPLLKEDYYINLCKRAINLVNESRGADEKERQEQERKAKISEILHRGNQPRFCICCGEIVGEVLGGDIIGTKWYDNHEVCNKGHVCKNCMNNCGGLQNCRYEEH